MASYDRSVGLLRTVLIASTSFAIVALAPRLAGADFPVEWCQPVQDVWNYGRKSVYVLAGIGILVMAVFAFFGRFKWSHLFSLGGGVLLVATAAELIDWLGGDSGMSC